MLGKILLTTKMGKTLKETANLILMFIDEPNIVTGGPKR